MDLKQQKNLIPLLSKYPPHSRFAEAYRTLRTNIQFAAIDKQFKSLLITSAGTDEGKTSTVANLGYTIAQTGKSVLMVDADMRRTGMTRNFQLTDKSGTTGLLANLLGNLPVEGVLDEIKVGDIIRLLGFQKKTGSLNLRSAEQEIELVFLKGKLSDIDWKTRPEERSLTNVLMTEKQIGEDA